MYIVNIFLTRYRNSAQVNANVALSLYISRNYKYEYILI